MADDFDALFDIPLDVTFSGEKGDQGDSVKGDKGDKGNPGQDGESVKGDKGDPGKDGKTIKGDPGDPGKDGKHGKNGVSITGDKGDEGLSAYEVWLQEGNEGDEEEFLKSLKGKDAKQVQWHGNAYTELRELEDTDLSPELEKGSLLAFNGTKWVEVPPPPGLNYYLVKNPLKDGGLAWQERGFSYLTDETGAILTDEAGNALEGKDTIDAKLLTGITLGNKTITFADSPYQMTSGDELLFVNATGGNVVVVPQLAADMTTRQTVVKVDTNAGGDVDIVPSGGELISGDPNKLITTQFTAQTFTSDGTQLLLV